jgi:UDP-glucose-4-epimerase GalE
MNILLTGGAGYIGAHVVRALAAAGHRCVVYDSLVTGHRQAVAGELIVADVADGRILREALRKHAIEAVVHLAALIDVRESMAQPGKYFRSNTLIGLTLLEAMRDAGVGRMVFSSTAAVYGKPERLPIQETDRLEPINPYGASKLCVEYMLRAYAEAHGMALVSLRYFNVAGADPAGDIGEAHEPEEHLIPQVLQVPLGKRSAIQVYGDDYDTPDGTCIRDYIHVVDLAAAHVLALGAFQAGTVKVYNLGNGEGFSVKQVIETCRQVVGRPIPTERGPRRPGDPPRLVASSAKAMAELSWQPRFPDLNTIIAHAWAWHRNHPNGYE